MFHNLIGLTVELSGSQTQQDFLQEYVDERHVLLDRLLLFDARNMDRPCGECGSNPGLIRCSDCFNSSVFCSDCIIKTHVHLPFHKVEKWNGKFFQKSSLHALRYIICLGHEGQPCPHTHTSPGFDTTMVLIHINGIFTHRILWCACPNVSEHYLQLFEAGLFASSFKQPQTAFTSQVLDYYFIDSLECKTAAMSFWQKLTRLTDNTFPLDVKVSNDNSFDFYIQFAYVLESLYGINEGI